LKEEEVVFQSFSSSTAAVWKQGGFVLVVIF
jgi:hypothetical protein